MSESRRDLPGHHPDCRVESRWHAAYRADGEPGGFYQTMSLPVCHPECPKRRALFSPESSLEAAAQFFAARMDRNPWKAWADGR